MDHEIQRNTGCLGPLRPFLRNFVPFRKPSPTPQISSGHLEHDSWHGKCHGVSGRANPLEAGSVFERSDKHSARKAEGLENPPSYSTSVSDEPVFASEILKTMEDEVDKLDPELRTLSLQIHDHPELMFKEKFAHDVLTKFMSSHGFVVTPHYLGFPTAWRASFKHRTGGPVLGVNSEMDALPGIGHACGHNLIAISGVGIALGVKAALEVHNIAGEVVLLGTPAEEGGGGKILLLEKGGYADMDACIMCHPSPGEELNFDVPPTLAIQSIDAEFFGRSAHASAFPWEGINALDAAVLSYTNLSAMRQQIKPTHRVHGIMEGRNWASNVIPDYAKMSYIVRAPTADEVKVLAERVNACFDAAALATGCKHKVTQGIAYANLKQNAVLQREFTKVAKKRYEMVDSGPKEAFASTDFGNVSYALPSLHSGYAIPAKSANHTPEFAQAASTPAAHRATLYTVKALAATGIRILSDAEFLKEVKCQFKSKATRGSMKL